MRLVALLLIASAFGFGQSSDPSQVKVMLTFNEERLVKEAFGREPAKHVSWWQLSAANTGEVPVLVDWGTLHRNAGQLRLVDWVTVFLLMEQGDKGNPLSRLGWFVVLSARGVGLASAGGLLEGISDSWTAGLLLFSDNGVKLGEIIRGQGPPTLINYEKVRGVDQFVIEPHQTAKGHVFSVKYTAQEGYQYPFTIPHDELRIVK